MARRLQERCICLLSRTENVDMRNTGNLKQILYTVPQGKKMIPDLVVLHSLSAAVACGSDNDFGDGAAADTWRNTVDFSGVDSITKHYVRSGYNAVYDIFDAGDEFGIMANILDDAAGAVTGTIDLYGYEYDA